jgi:hypothetical protein
MSLMMEIKRERQSIFALVLFFFFVDFVSIQIFLWIIKKKKKLKRAQCKHFGHALRIDSTG